MVKDFKEIESSFFKTISFNSFPYHILVSFPVHLPESIIEQEYYF